MQYRMLGRTGMNVSTVSFGAWAIGGSWGDVDDRESLVQRCTRPSTWAAILSTRRMSMATDAASG